MTPEQFVKATELYECQRKLRLAEDRLRGVADEVRQAYENGRQDARGEGVRAGSLAQSGEDIAYLTLPDNGGRVQFHVVGSTGPGGRDSLAGLVSLRVWGPPDGQGYGVHEQGGGNLTDMSMLFDLDERGITVHSFDLRSRRREPGSAP